MIAPISGTEAVAGFACVSGAHGVENNSWVLGHPQMISWLPHASSRRVMGGGMSRYLSCRRNGGDRR